MSDQAEIHPERLIGAWRLVEWRTQQVTGTIGHPFGPDAIGLIIYTQDGHMSGHLMHAHRPAFSRPRTQAVEFDAGDPTELAAAFNSYLAYGGGWTLEEDGLVRHHVVVASIPGWAGTTLIRRVHFAGEQLVLTTLPRTVDGVEQQGILRWERA